MELHADRSKDGVTWQIEPKCIQFECQDEEIGRFEYGYALRVCLIDDRCYVTWCNAYAGWPTISIAYTHDFKMYYQTEKAFLPFNRNGVLFPRRIDGRLAYAQPAE